MIDAATTIPLASKVVPIHEHEVLSMRALISQTRANLARDARLHKEVFDKGSLDDVDLWWLDQYGITFVVSAKENMTVTADAWAQAAAGEEVTVGRRVCTVRHGQGKTAWMERRKTEVVGIADLTTDDQYGTPKHGRHHNRRDYEAKPIYAVVVRRWNGRATGRGARRFS